MAIENPNKKNMLVGMIWCVLGIAVTFISYYCATEGGSFSIFYGAIIYGIYQAGKGWTAHLRELRAGAQMGEFKKWVLIGVCALALVGGLTYASWDMMHASPFEEKEQVVDLHEDDVRLTLPAGFAKIDTRETEDTDSTYASMSIYSYDSDYGFLVEYIEYGFSDTLATEDIYDRLAINAMSYSDTILAFPRMRNLGDREALRYIGYFNDDNTVAVCHEIVHNGNLLSVYCFGMGPEIDSLQIACAAEFVRYNIELK